MIKPETIEQVRTSTDIVELVGGYLPLKRVGRNYRGLCPFHSERSPSFYVNPERQTYHCFGCGAGGSAINFVMVTEKLEFPEAVRFLAKRLGITVEEDRMPGRNQALYDACEQAAVFYEQQLARSSSAQAYLERRGLGRETVRRFRLGYAPPGNVLRGQAKRRGLAEVTLVSAGLLVKREEGLTDYFYDRVMFPVFSLSGKVIGFGARVMGDSEPKYLNSPDTAVFRKGDILYGVFQTKAYLREAVPILVEGNFDLLSLVNAGVNHVVAGLGTALTPAQAQLLRRYGGRAIICYDGDSAGRKASRRALEVLLGAGVDPQVALMPDDTDPDDYVRKHGGEGLLALLNQAPDFVDYLLAARRLDSVAEQRLAVAELAGLLKLVGDKVTHELYANRIADRFRLDRRSLPQDSGQSAIQSRPRPTGAEERLVGMVAQHQELARQAREMRLSDALDDPALQTVCRLAEEHADDVGYGPGMLIDLIDEEEMRRRLASWTFVDEGRPTDGTLRQVGARMRTVKAGWLRRLADAAYERGDTERADLLNAERSRLLGSAAAERSVRS